MSRVRVGILHSKTGKMAISELPLQKAALVAIAQINQTGGVLGKLIEPVSADGASDPREFQCQARKLIQQAQVSTIFGGGISATRKAVLPVLEELNAQLWYPWQYEGLECSPNIFSTGSCPNQPIESAVSWLLQNDRKRFYLLGSEGIFSSTANKIIKGQLQENKGIVVAEEYISPGTTEFAEIIASIGEVLPNIIFNTLNGESNRAFYQQYAESEINPSEIPILSVTLTTAELQSLGEAAVNHYWSGSYFQSLDTSNNHRFVQDFRHYYGKEQVISEEMATAYTQVYLWKQAVELAESFAVERVRAAAVGSSFEAPSGLVCIEPNYHLRKLFRIGRILSGGQIELVTRDSHPIKPLPWLGHQQENLRNSDTVIELLANVSEKVGYLEQKSRQLEPAMKQLQLEIAKRRRVEAVILDSQAELHALFAAMTELIYVLDAQGRYLKIAPTNPTIPYKLANELIGKTFHDVFELEQADTLLSYIQEALETQETLKAEYSLKIEGREVWFDASVSPISANLVIWVARDITKRKQTELALRQAEERYRSIFENTDKGLFQITLEGHFLSANPALAILLRYESPEELIASFTNIDEQLYVRPQDRSQFWELILAHDRITNFVSQVYRRDGSIIWILENAHLVRDEFGQPLYCEGSIIDITERKIWEEALRYQRQRAEGLLLNILPLPVARRLKQAENNIADSFDQATVLFADLVNFTEMAAITSPTELVDLLNQIFSEFDQLSDQHLLEKIKTIGDSYMVVGGLPTPMPDQVEAVAEMALDMQETIARFKRQDNQPFRLRIGIHTGPVVAGVIGTKKFSYDLWGDTVNVASRMESMGQTGRIQVSQNTYELLKNKYLFMKRGMISIKGKGKMVTYWLIGRKVNYRT
ncbi:MAG: transporter substrate-binding protein [Symploca sp. SIO2C1]|nr:transporter substrate-binding protein [Symploca sp. SIO2C1]